MVSTSVDPRSVTQLSGICKDWKKREVQIDVVSPARVFIFAKKVNHQGKIDDDS
jgi:hypothetical protein